MTRASACPPFSDRPGVVVGFVAGSTILIFAFSILLIASVCFVAGLPVTRAQIILAACIALVYAWWGCARYGNQTGHPVRPDAAQCVSKTSWY